MIFYIQQGPDQWNQDGWGQAGVSFLWKHKKIIYDALEVWERNASIHEISVKLIPYTRTLCVSAQGK